MAEADLCFYLKDYHSGLNNLQLHWGWASTTLRKGSRLRLSQGSEQFGAWASHFRKLMLSISKLWVSRESWGEWLWPIHNFIWHFESGPSQSRYPRWHCSWSNDWVVRSQLGWKTTVWIPGVSTGWRAGSMGVVWAYIWHEGVRDLEMAYLVRCLPHKRKSLSSDPKTHKKLSVSAHTCSCSECTCLHL